MKDSLNVVKVNNTVITGTSYGTVFGDGIVTTYRSTSDTFPSGSIITIQNKAGSTIAAYIVHTS